MKIQTLDIFMLMKRTLGSSGLDCMVVVIMMLVILTMIVVLVW